MVEGFSAQASCLHEDFQIAHHLLLAAEVAEAKGAQAVLEVAFLPGELLISYIKVFFHRFLSLFTFVVFRLPNESFVSSSQR
jgi:hypothetical protein